MNATPPSDMDRLRAGAKRCPTLARLLKGLDDPERNRAQLREAIKYHLRQAHPDCPGNAGATEAPASSGTCQATRDGGSLTCYLPAGHTGLHESRLIIWS